MGTLTIYFGTDSDRGWQFKGVTKEQADAARRANRSGARYTITEPNGTETDISGGVRASLIVWTPDTQAEAG